MNRKFVITRFDNKIITAVLENEIVVELHCMNEEKHSDTAVLGNIYIGKVKNIVANIGAAFVEVEKGIECYYSIADNPLPVFTNKIEKKPLCIGDEILVQVSKEAVKTKVPSVSSKIELAGKYAVLTSGDTRIGASSRLGKKEKERLIQIARQYESAQYGIIMRTNAKDIEESILKKEIERLTEEYQELIRTAQTRVCYSCLKKAPKQYLTELKNINQEGLSEFIVEDIEIYKEMKEFLEENQKEDLGKLRLYNDRLLPLHKLYSIEKHIENVLKEKAWMKSGAYLVIQPTEALTVIDVNTGKYISKKKDESEYLKINKEAAIEAAKQIRLRNLSGIIIIDFINLSQKEHMNELIEVLQSELRKDPVAASYVDTTKLQLVEVTRKKIRKPFHETYNEN